MNRLADEKTILSLRESVLLDDHTFCPVSGVLIMFRILSETCRDRIQFSNILPFLHFSPPENKKPPLGGTRSVEARCPLYGLNLKWMLITGWCEV
jgi:hypothetical protein